MAIVIDNTFVLAYADSAEQRVDEQARFSGQQLNPQQVTDGKIDPRQQPILAMTKDFLGEADKLLLRIIPDAAEDMDISETTVSIPITRMNTKTGKVWPDTLTKANFGMTADSGADAYTAATIVTIGTYTVVAQEQIWLGHELAETSRPFLAFSDLD